MALELIGAGFGRTGTLSLKHALEAIDLGPCHHMMEVFTNPGSEKVWHAAWQGREIDWDALLGRYRSQVDWPGCAFWKTLADRYPEAKVLLSVRDPERWYDSVMETIYQVTRQSLASDDAVIRERLAMANAVIFEGTFEGRFEDRAFAIDVYQRHIEEVQKTIPSERLLVYEVKQGWEPLCAFVGRPVPEIAFPHVNSREEFQTRFRREE